MNKQKVINFSVRFRGIKAYWSFDQVPKAASKWNHRDGGDERLLTLLILIYFIYFEEFIVNLSAFEALMPFLWMLKNVNIELFSSPLFFFI